MDTCTSPRQACKHESCCDLTSTSKTIDLVDPLTWADAWQLAECCWCFFAAPSGSRKECSVGNKPKNCSYHQLILILPKCQSELNCATQKIKVWQNEKSECCDLHLRLNRVMVGLCSPLHPNYLGQGTGGHLLSSSYPSS